MAAHAAHSYTKEPTPKPHTPTPRSSFVVTITDALVGQVLVPAGGVILSLTCVTPGRLSDQLILTDANGVPVIAIGQSDLAGGRAIAGRMDAPFDGSLTLASCPVGSTWSATAAYV
jgi:hypothetical protein